MAAVGAFAQDGFVLAEFAEDLGAFSAELVGVGFELGDESVEGAEAVLGALPLRGRKALEQVWIPAAFLDQQRHGVLVGGEEFQQWFNAQLKG